MLIKSIIHLRYSINNQFKNAFLAARYNFKKIALIKL